MEGLGATMRNRAGRLIGAIGICLVVATASQAEVKRAQTSWKTKVEYVLAGDIDGSSLSEQASNTVAASGLALNKDIGNDWLFKGEVGLSVSDDYLDDSRDTWSWIASAQVGRDEEKQSVAPFAKWAVKVAYTDFSRGYKRTDNTFSGGANFTHRGKVNCPIEKGCKNYWIRFTPEAAVIVSDADDKDQWYWKVAVAGETSAPFLPAKMLLHGYANYYQGKYDNLVAPMTTRRKDKGFQAFAGFELKEWLKRKWPTANYISEAKLGVRYVWQESNALDPKESYSRVQLLPTLALKSDF